MNIHTQISYTLTFDNDLHLDSFLAIALFEYIVKKAPDLYHNVGFEDGDSRYQDFTYSFSTSNLDIKKRIEKYIHQFQKEIEKVTDLLEAKVQNGEICESNDFLECFEELSMINKRAEKLDKKLHQSSYKKANQKI